MDVWLVGWSVGVSVIGTVYVSGFEDLIAIVAGYSDIEFISLGIKSELEVS